MGEAAVQFEHRDMHWGNLLLRPSLAASLPFRLQGADIAVATGGVQVREGAARYGLLAERAIQERRLLPSDYCRSS